jgi:hypothetical protein
MPVVERADLSSSLGLERMAPVSVAPAVQGQSSPEDGEGKPRRRPPPPEKASAGPAAEEGGDPPPHRVDSLA